MKKANWFVVLAGGAVGLAAVLLANSTGTKAFILFSAVCVVAIVGFAVIFGTHRRPTEQKDPEKSE